MDIRKPRRRGLSRREVMKTAAAAGAVASVGPFFHVNPAKAAKKLNILQWSHFVPGYDKWFNNEYVKEWGSKNDTEVVVDNINLALIPSRAAAEVSAQKGHDLVMFLSPPSVYEDQVLDMKDVYAECREEAWQGDRSCGEEHLQPEDQEVFRFLRQLRARSGELPHRSLGRYRHEAGHAGMTSARAAS